MSRAVLLAAALAAVSVVGCGRTAADASPVAGGAPASDHPPSGCELALDGRHEGGHLAVLVNGFPVDRGSGVSRYRAYRASVSTALVAGANTVAVQMTPLLGRSGRSLTAGRPALSAAVACAGGGGAVLGEGAVAAAHAEWRVGLLERWAGWLAAEDSLLAARPWLAAALADSAAGALGAGPALDSARAWARAHPAEASASFEYVPGPGGPDFSAVFREAPVIGAAAADSARLRAYAVRLRDLTADRDTAALARAFSGKYADEFAWWGGAEGVGEDSASFAARTRGGVVMGAFEPFSAEDVRLRSWSGGRVWELYRDGADGLLQEPGRGPYREVYVGEGPDGRLRVVR